MNKYFSIIFILLFIIACLSIKVLPDNFVYRTELQKREIAEFCDQGLCGLSMPISPYEAIKQSIINIIRG